MVRIGYTQLCEQRGPKELVSDVVLAEQAGFEFSVVSDHFHPWLEQQGHSPYAWAILSASAIRTRTIELMSYVTCPTIRYHPAVVAQKAATVALLADGRFRLGLGAGEALNERVVGRGWPDADTRQEMLREAIEVIRALWSGGYVTYSGEYLKVESARLFDLPSRPIPLGVAVSGTNSCRLAGELADLLIATAPQARLIELFHQHGGEGRPAVAQLPVCYGPDPAKCLSLARDQFAWAATGWKVQSELPGPVNFAAATQFVREEDMAQLIPHGPDLEPYVAGVREYVRAGFDEVALVQIGPDQDAFCDFYANTLRPALAALS